MIYNSTESQINKVEVVKVESYSRNTKARDHRETKVHEEYKSDQVIVTSLSSHLGAARRRGVPVPPGHLAPAPGHLPRHLPQPRPQADRQLRLLS